MFILLLIIGILYLRRVDRRSLAYYFVLILVISLVGNLFIKSNYLLYLSDIGHFFWIAIVLSFLILPWEKYKGINTITCKNPNRLKTATIALIVFFLIQLVGCAILAYYVITTIDNINKFKYVDGTTDFYYSLGINLRPFMLATLFYPLSYIMIPLHQYYLSKGEKWLSIWCFIVSLLSIVYGLTYFSRSHLLHYIFIYLCSFWLLRDIFTTKSIKRLKKLMIIGTVVVSAYFIYISVSRFEDYDNSDSIAAISSNSVINSLFDYLVMWWRVSETLFSRFDWNIFNGQLAFQDISRLLSMAGIHIGSSGAALLKQRELILGEYSGAFIGVGGYFLYDFGPIVSIILLFVYNRMVSSWRPRGGIISIERLIFVFILALLPTFAIFYSVLNVILLTMFLGAPVVIYLKIRK